MYHDNITCIVASPVFRTQASDSRVAAPPTMTTGTPKRTHDGVRLGRRGDLTGDSGALPAAGFEPAETCVVGLLGWLESVSILDDSRC
jgi:hypothetical protein